MNGRWTQKIDRKLTENSQEFQKFILFILDFQLTTPPAGPERIAFEPQNLIETHHTPVLHIKIYKKTQSEYVQGGNTITQRKKEKKSYLVNTINECMREFRSKQSLISSLCHSWRYILLREKPPP